MGYTKYLKTGESHKPKQKIAIIQWVSEQGELDDLYYYQIRLGIEKEPKSWTMISCAILTTILLL